MIESGEFATAPRGPLAKAALHQIAGRVAMSAGRLVIAILLIRMAGSERYGEYSLVLSLLVIGDWLVDFGISDIGVRNLAQQSERRDVLLCASRVVTGVQSIAAFVLLVLVLYFMGYPEQIVRAGLIGGVGLIFYAGVVVYRVAFRAVMRMGLDVWAEVTGLVVMFPLIVYAAAIDSSVEVFIACYVVARVVHFAVAAFVGRTIMAPRIWSVARGEAIRLFRQALPLGITGLLVSVNDNMIPVVISKLAGMDAVAEYAYTFRFAMPAIIVIQALNVAFFPLLSRSFAGDRLAFARTQQDALESSVLLGAGIFCFLNASSEFLLGLAGSELAGASLAFRLMTWAVMLRVLTMPISPLVVVAGGQGKVLWLTILSVVLQLGALVWLVPTYAAVGAIAAYLIVKLVVGTVPIIVISGRMTGCPLRWRTALLALACAGAALGATKLAFGLGPLWAGLLCTGLYAVFAFGSGACSIVRARALTASLMRRGL